MLAKLVRCGCQVNKSLLDTDTLSLINKALHPSVQLIAERYLAVFSSFSLSTITVMEIVRGYHLAGRHDRLANFISGLAAHEILPFTQSTAELAGEIDADLQCAGQPIGRADPMIAATAIEHGLVLVTGNTGHFERIQAMGYPLLLDNWRDSPASAS